MEPQRVVGGRYRLVAKLGSGGMGTVWHAYDERLHREVAIKEIRVPPTVTDEERHDLSVRAMSEARSAARLDHPNIVSVHDAFDDADQTWIVMQLVRGKSLDEAVRARGRLSSVRAAELGLALLDALEAAHAAGILHRDLKPSNVLLPDTGGFMLTDFSIAAVVDAVRLTRTGALLGTPGYVAPERLVSGRSGPPVDLFGLGATLYFATEGRGPFERDSPLAELFATVNQPHPEPEHAGPLVEVIDGLLAKDPDDRWTAGRTREALRTVASHPVASHPVVSHPMVSAPASATVGMQETTAAGTATAGTQETPTGMQETTTGTADKQKTTAGTATVDTQESTAGTSGTQKTTAMGRNGANKITAVPDDDTLEGTHTAAALRRRPRTWLVVAVAVVVLAGAGVAARYALAALAGGGSSANPTPTDIKLVVATPGGNARTTFAGTEGQNVFIQVVSSTLPDACGVLKMLGPDEESIASGCIINGKGYIDGTVLPTTGQYQVVVDPGEEAVGETVIRVIDAPGQQGSIEPNGPEIAATNGQPGARARFTFTGTAGQRVFVGARSSTLPDQCGVLTLHNPDGDSLASGCVINKKGHIDTVELPVDGEYTVVIDPQDMGTGTTQLRLYAVTDQKGELSPGGPEVLITIDQPGKVAELSFAGIAGQRVFVDVTDATLPDQCGVLVLRDPDGDSEASGCIIDGKGEVARDGSVLKKTGTYTVLVDPADSKTGRAKVRLRI
jgi:Protein kinase domain